MNDRFLDETIAEELATLCREQDIVPVDVGASDLVDEDLFERGLVDSMGLTHLQSAVAEAFSVEIPTELFVAELRSLGAVARYVAAERAMEEAA